MGPGWAPRSTDCARLVSNDALRATGCPHCHLQVLALAHIFRRPIVCYASAAVGEVREADEGRTMSQYAASGARMSGVYLPSLLSPEECASRDPLLLAFTPGHFSALCGTERAADTDVWRALGLPPAGAGADTDADGTVFAAAAAAAIPIPLVDETLAPLPVLFPPADVPSDASSIEALVRSYMDLLQSAPLGPPGTPAAERTRIPLTRQRLPPTLERRRAAGGPVADAYYAAVWQRRVSAAVPREPRDAQRARKAPSASRESSFSSWHLVTEDDVIDDVIDETLSGGLPSPTRTPPIVVAARPAADDEEGVVVSGSAVL